MSIDSQQEPGQHPPGRRERPLRVPPTAGRQQGSAPIFRDTAIVAVACALVGFIGLELAQAQTRAGQASSDVSVRDAASSQARAQASNAARRVPATARLGVLKPGVFPQASLDGKAVTLGAGFRLMDTLNRIVVPASVLGTSQVVAYQTGPIGEVTAAWILTDAERNEIRRRQ